MTEIVNISPHQLKENLSETCQTPVIVRHIYKKSQTLKILQKSNPHSWEFTYPLLKNNVPYTSIHTTSATERRTMKIFTTIKYFILSQINLRKAWNKKLTYIYLFIHEQIRSLVYIRFQKSVNKHKKKTLADVCA